MQHVEPMISIYRTTQRYRRVPQFPSPSNPHFYTKSIYQAALNAKRAITHHSTQPFVRGSLCKLKTTCPSCGSKLANRLPDCLDNRSFGRTVEMSKLVVHRWNPTEDGQLSVDNMHKKLAKNGYSVYDYKFEPGTSFPEHTHGQEKMDCIVSGQLCFKMFGEEIILGPGDCLEVPKNTPHSAHVHGKEQVVFVDATRK